MKLSTLLYNPPTWAKLVHYIRTVSALHVHCSADTMKPSKGGREDHPTFMQTSQDFTSLVIGGRGQAQSAVARVCWRMVVAFRGHRHSALTRLGPNLLQYAALCGPLMISHATDSQ